MLRYFDKILNLNIENDKEVEKLVKALDCKGRRDILRLLSSKMMSIMDIAVALNMPKSTASEHVKQLIDTGLISVVGQKDGRGSGKILSRQYEKVVIAVSSGGKPTNVKNYSQQIPIGSYSAFKINKYCGIIGEDGYIGARDDITSFYSPLRFIAQLIWFDYGYLEYTLPVQKIDPNKIVSVSVSAELCSEAPGYNENWKSDISFSFNGNEICTYTSPGDYGARRGLLTPDWWQEGTQYGVIKQVEVTEHGTFLDGTQVSPVTVKDLGIAASQLFTFRIGVNENAKNRGGINLFGRKFGDYNQNIIVTFTYEE